MILRPAQQDAQPSGFEWGGYYFKEVPLIFQGGNDNARTFNEVC